MVGMDWSQAGIASLYNMIERNGYKFMYLSSRSIGQSRVTRDYIRSIRQGDLTLPDGPVLLSPSSLIQAFHKYDRVQGVGRRRKGEGGREGRGGEGRERGGGREMDQYYCHPHHLYKPSTSMIQYRGEGEGGEEGVERERWASSLFR